MLFRSSFLWRYLAANELDCWMFVDAHMDLSSSFLEKLHAQDEYILKLTRFQNSNGESLSKIFKWALTDHVQKQLLVHGVYWLEIDERNVTELYHRA